MTAEVWHRLLSAELAPSKSRELLRVLDSSSLSTLSDILSLPFLSPIDRARIEGADMSALEKYLESGGRIIGYNELPPSFDDVEFPPLGLYVWGNTDCLAEPTISIVGTRRAGSYGKAVATKFAADFARAGVTVVSGGAYGIDASAHNGCLNEGGKTAAVFFTSIDQAYPQAHRSLFEKIRNCDGCLVSQFALGTKGAWESRPLSRNRIIAALSHAVVVIEAPSRSGSLSTASEAAELGRPVFVVPGPIDNLNFQGSHQLIKEGAILIDHPIQVLDYLGISPVSATKQSPSSSLQQAILKALSTTPISSEVLASRIGYDHADVMNELTDLELEGSILRADGKFTIVL